MDHHHSHASHPLLKTSYLIPIAIVVGGLIVAIAVYLSIARTPSTNDGNPSLVRSVDATDHIFGSPAARVTVIEYSDFECEYCKIFNETMHQLVANEGAKGDVAWVLRNFPLIEIHPNALSHARAAECVAQTAGSDVFWKFEDLLFKNQPADPTRYGALAKEAGVTNSAAFAKCYADAAGASSTVEAKILADRQNALDMGAKGTPFSIVLIAGKQPIILNGNYPYSALKEIVDKALSN